MSKPAVMRHRSSHSARQEEEFRRDGDGWQGRPLGAGAGDRALTEPERMRALRLARHLYKRGGMYASIVDRLVDFTVGDGVVLDVQDEEVAQHLESVLPGCTSRSPARDCSWWRDLKRRWRETLNEGEYLLVVETGRRNPGEASAVPTGAVRFGRMEVEQVRDVHVSGRDADELLALSIEPGGTGQPVTIPIARPGVMPVEQVIALNGQPVRTGRYAAISYWSTNRLGPRGAPHLLRLLGKTGLVDDVVDANARKAELLNRFVMHGTYKAEGDDTADDAFENELFEVLTNPIGPEAFVSSTEREVKIQAITPDLKPLDQRALYDLVVDYVCGSASVPKHWFGGAEGTTRATAIEQGSPAHRMLVSLQADLQQAIEQLVSYLVWLGKASGRIRMDRPERVTVNMALIATRDSQRDAGVLQQVTAVLSFLEELGYLSGAESQRIARHAVQSQTFIEAELDDEAPPLKVRDIGALLGSPEFRAKVQTSLPGHRARIRKELGL